MRSARRPHRFHSYQQNGQQDEYEVRFDYGAFDPPKELHLVMKRFPKLHVEAFWDGAIFVEADLPERPRRD
jgi:hypothetical protein